MIALLRLLHVFAVAIWLGSIVFFTIAGVLIFQSFSEVSRLPAEDRPMWLPLPDAFARESPEGFPDPIRLEQGSRAAGVAVSGIFPVYYALQGACGVVALVTALIVAQRGEGGLRGLRFLLCALALFTVLGGWWLEQRVSELRIPRNELTDRVLTSNDPSAEFVAQARTARGEFARWHGISLIQNFLTLILVAGVTACLPALSREGNRQA